MTRFNSIHLALLFSMLFSSACLAQCVYRTISVSRVGGAVVGTIADPNGIPISNVNVELKRRGERIAAAITNEAGEFWVHAKPGEYEIHAHTSEFSPGFARVNLESDSEQRWFPSHIWMILTPGVAIDQCTFTTASHKQFEKTIQKQPSN